MAKMREFTVEEFLAHETRGRSEFLGSEWKKAGFINVWLHRKRPFSMIWQHQIPRIDVRDDPETGRPKRSIFSGNYRCLEGEDILSDQYRRNKETGERRSPPEICPICRMIEYVHMQVIRREIHWLQPVFDFDVGNRDANVLLRASGMWNGYKPEKLDDQQKDEMDAAGISPKFGWKENIQASLKYIFCLVDDAQVGRGVQIMKEGQALGDKLKTAISREMKRNPRNPALGDPTQSPYAFCFEYREKETPDKKYEAYRIEQEITQQILDLITATEAPDLTMLEGNYQPDTLRASLERVCQMDLPWDDFFTPEAEAALREGSEPEQERERPAPTRAPAPPPAPRGRAPAPPPPRAPARAPEAPRLPPGVRSAGVDPRPAPGSLPRPAPAPVEMFACDNEACGRPIKATDPKCPYCGHEYDVEAPAAPPPPPALRRRSEAKRAASHPPPPRAPADSATSDGQYGVSAPRAARPSPAPREARPQAAQPPPPPRTVDETGSPAPSPGDDLGFGEFAEDELPF